jgi:glutathione peroxidase
MTSPAFSWSTDPQPRWSATILNPVRRFLVLLPALGALGALVVLGWAAAGTVHAAGPAVVGAGVTATAPAKACPPLLDHTLPRLQDDKPQSLCQYAGKVLLMVNTASYCGFTSQFKGLEALNERYAPQGLVVMGFPSNDFRQEDADARKTADVCFNTYGVKFPMFATMPVRGPDAHPLFATLAKATGSAPGWNFNKYLVGRDGRPIEHFGSMTDPTGRTLTDAIERALAGR